MTCPPSVFQFFKPYLRAMRIPFFIGMTMLFLGEGCNRIGIWFGAQLIERLSATTGDKTALLGIGLTLIILYGLAVMLRCCLVTGIIRIDAFFIPRIFGRVYKDLFKQIHKQSPAYFETEMSGNLAAKINALMDDGEMLYYCVVYGIVYNVNIALITTLSFAVVDWKLGLLMAVLMPLYYAFVYFISRRLMQLTADVAEASQQSDGVLVDSISNAETVKSFGRFTFEKRHYFKSIKKASACYQNFVWTSGKIFFVQTTVRALMRALFCLLPFLLWYHDKITLAEFVFMQSVFISLDNAMGKASDDLPRLMMVYGGLQNALNTLFKPITLTDKKDAVPFVYQAGKIEFDNITYQYHAERPLFKDFSLTIESKQKVGLVGVSGSGKSSLIKLLLRYYDVAGGAIRIDGQALPDVFQRSFRQSIALIPQQPSLFNRTVMENIRYGKPTATDDEVIAAAQKAYCHDFIMRLPHGYDSKVGERGVMLSGGERQRIAIARAILKNAPILILDEATAALDSESEMLIQRALTDLMKTKTVIAVAHRLSTLKKMDVIYVLDKGKIIQSGTHGELIRQDGVYKRFYDIQTQMRA